MKGRLDIMGLEKIYGGKPLDGNLEDFERKSVYDESRQAIIDSYYDRVIESRRQFEQKAQLKQNVWSRIKNKYTSITNENSTDEIIQAAKDFMQKSHSYSYDGKYTIENIYFDGKLYENDRRTMAQHLKTLLEHKYNETIEHIELPENEQISNKINQTIEELEKFGHLYNSHKYSIAQKQGLESKELFSLIDTFKKKSAGAFARPSLSNMQEINSKISKRLEFLESKLSILIENKEIDGNEERIVDIEKQISSIRSVWTEVVKTNTEKILRLQAKYSIELEELYMRIGPTEEIYTEIRPGIKPIKNLTAKEQLESLKVEKERTKEQLCGLIGNESLRERFEAEEQAILKAEQEAKEKAEEQARLKAEQEAKEKAEEQARLKAEQEAKEKAEEQARLKAEQEAKEKAEEQARLKAEQEAKEKAEEQARLKAEQEAKEKAEQEAKRQIEERANSDEVDYLIEEISRNHYGAWYGKTALEMDTEIKNKVKTLENKIKELEQNGDEPEIQQNIQMLMHRIEKLEDAWEIYTQCFDSKSSFSMRNSSSNMFREYRTNYISISKSIELFERFQKGEEVPEVYGKHHRERYEREQAKAEEQARLKAEQEAKEKAEEQARLKAEQEAKEKAYEQEKKEWEAEIARKRAELDKEILAYEQYEELISRKPELYELLIELKYEDYSAGVHGHISERMGNLLNDLKKLPENERKIILQQYNKFADLTINEQGQIIKEGNIIEVIQPERKDDEQESTQEEQVVEDYWNRVNSQQAKEYEQQQPEIIRPREESIRDVIGDKRDWQSNMQMQEVKTPTVDLWMNRFDSWYSAIDRVSKNVKAKFVKMKSDIINAISNKIKERMNKREVNTQEQDSSER